MLLSVARHISRTPVIGKILKYVYHRIKWTKQIKGLKVLDNDAFECFSREMFPVHTSKRTVDIIVPIYNAYEYLVVLVESIFNNSDLPFSLILINDASTDNRVSEYLKDISITHENIVVIHNDENIGFVKSINKGLKFSKNDVVIINTDVEVPKNWLTRLMHPIFSTENIASATPMSNSSTITSFPNLLKTNDLFHEMSLEAIDDEFKKIKSSNQIYIDTPTGHGFCMAMSITAIKKVGFFDEIFGEGCGEENDWCMRAIKKGFRNVIVPNLFCFHKHTASFTKTQKDLLMEKNVAIVKARHPNYSKLVKKTVQNAFYENLRFILLGLLYNKVAKKSIVCFTNSLGGGSTFANKDFVSKRLQSGFFVINIRSAFRKESYQLELLYGDCTFSVHFKNIDQIEKVLSLFDIDEVMIHQLCGYVKLEQVLSIITSTKQKFGFKLCMDIRDFFIICPSVQLLNTREQFCHACIDEAVCDECISHHGNTDPSFKDMVQWREMWGTFLCALDQIYVYSEFTRKTILKVFDKLLTPERLTLGKIPIDYIRPVKLKPKKQDHPIHIGVIGNIGLHKGLRLLNELADNICFQGKASKIKLYIIGKLDIRYNHSHFIHLGEYKRELLPDIIEKHNIDVIFIPSIWGETFCRTAEEGILMGMPTACFDLGAPAERVRNYEKGLVISSINANQALNEIVEHVKSHRNGDQLW